MTPIIGIEASHNMNERRIIIRIACLYAHIQHLYCADEIFQRRAHV